MVLPLVKLGSLAFRTLSKPIAARLKYNAGIHPKFRGLIIGIAQVVDDPSHLALLRLRYFSYGNLCVDWIHGFVSIWHGEISFCSSFLCKLQVRFSVSCRLRLLERLIVLCQYAWMMQRAFRYI
uniref:Uncharacterized protein n=1 Tax=Zea mays TaxID=4577 RepID=B6U2Z6_MAIZE|nr:hypothetical protein [Zea mays]